MVEDRLRRDWVNRGEIGGIEERLGRHRRDWGSRGEVGVTEERLGR